MVAEPFCDAVEPISGTSMADEVVPPVTFAPTVKLPVSGTEVVATSDVVLAVEPFMEPVVGDIVVVAVEMSPPGAVVGLKSGGATGILIAGAASQRRRASIQITTAGQTDRQTG